MSKFNRARRRVMRTALAGIAVSELAFMSPAAAQSTPRILWERNSPAWRFDDATFARSAAAFENPDYVDVVIHSFRHRLGLAAGGAQYTQLEQQLASLPVISVPTVTLDGEADGVVAATDGKSTAAKFSGSRHHRTVPNGGHNLPQEGPRLSRTPCWN